MVNREILATARILATRQTSWIQKSFLRRLKRVSSINNYGSSFPSRTSFRPQGTNLNDRNDVSFSLFSTGLVVNASNTDPSILNRLAKQNFTNHINLIIGMTYQFMLEKLKVESVSSKTELVFSKQYFIKCLNRVNILHM